MLLAVNRFADLLDSDEDSELREAVSVNEIDAWITFALLHHNR